MPLVSILVPVYNGERWLGDALASALAQTHEELEVLVGDDGSTDGSLALAREIAATDARVRVLTAERNLGPAANQIRLHETARGAFIKPLLQDDLLAPACVARLLAPMLLDERVVLSTSKRGLIDDDGAALPDLVWTTAITAQDAVFEGRAFGDAMLRATRNLIGEVSTALYRAGLVAPAELWHLGSHAFHTNADIALWLKLLAAGALAYTPEELSSFRQHDAQSSRDVRIIVRGMLEWARLPIAARGLGFLADPDVERATLAQAAEVAGGALDAAADDPELLGALQAALSALIGRLEALDASAAVA